MRGGEEMIYRRVNCCADFLSTFLILAAQACELLTLGMLGYKVCAGLQSGGNSSRGELYTSPNGAPVND